MPDPIESCDCATSWPSSLDSRVQHGKGKQMAELLVVEDDAAIAGPLDARPRKGRAHHTLGHHRRRCRESPSSIDCPSSSCSTSAFPTSMASTSAGTSAPSHERLPIIVLTARREELDIVEGFEAGADDYMTKPFRLSELLARIRARLRAVTATRLESDDIAVDVAARRAWQADRELGLSTKEFDLLAELVRGAGTVVKRELLMDKVWGTDFVGSTKTLDVHMAWLRRKLGDDAAAPRYITTVRGIGYRFEGSGVEPVAEPGHGGDRRCLDVRAAQLGPQRADVHGERVRRLRPVRVPHRRRSARPCSTVSPACSASAASRSNSRDGQFDRLAGQVARRAMRSIRSAPTDDDGRRPVEMAADASRQHGERERLGDVVVGAGVEGVDDIELVVASGHDDDRPLGISGPQLAAQLDAVAIGKPEIDQGDVVVVGVAAPLPPTATRSCRTRPDQTTFAGLAHAGIVLDDQHSRPRARHRRQLAPSRRR